MKKSRATIQYHAFVIQELVRMVDELRQPYNNSNRHDLYVKACDLLNKLDEWNLIPRLPEEEPEGWIKGIETVEELRRYLNEN